LIMQGSMMIPPSFAQQAGFPAMMPVAAVQMPMAAAQMPASLVSPAAGFGPMRRDGQPVVPSANLYVSDLPAGIADEVVHQIFSAYGQIVRLKTMPPNVPGGKSVALVQYETVETAIWVQSGLNGQIPAGMMTPITVRFADPPKKGKGKGPYENVPVPASVVANPPPEGCPFGDWICAACGDLQFAKNTTCRKCGAPKGTTSIPGGVVKGVHGSLNKDGPGGGLNFGRAVEEPKPESESAQRDNLYVRNLPVTATEEEVKQIFSQYGNVLRVKVMNHQTTCAALVQFSTVEEGMWVKQNVSGSVPDGYPKPVDIKFYDPGSSKGKHGGKGTAMAALGAEPWSGWGKGDYGKGDYGKGGYGKGDYGKGDYGKGDYGKGKGKGGLNFSMKEVVDGFEKAGTLPGGGAPRENNQASLYVGGLPPDAEDIDLYRLFNPFGAVAPKGCKVMMRTDGASKGFGFVNFQDPAAAQEAIRAFDGTALPDNSVLVVKIKTEKT